MSTFSFNAEHAKKYGVTEAVILYNFIFWIKHNKANNKHFYDGKYWTYNSIKAFEELFPFLSTSQIRTALKNLKDKGAIVTAEYNKLAFDRTTWYAVSDEIYTQSIETADLSKSTNAKVKNNKSDLRNLANGEVEINKPIPDINTYNKTNKKEYPSFQNPIKKDNRNNFKEREYDFDINSIYSNVRNSD